MNAARLGARSGLAVVIVGVAYGAVLLFGFVRHGLSEPISDPVLAIMELLTVTSALPLLAMFVALNDTVEPESRLWATLGLCFAVMFALATIGVHTFELTAGRQLHSRGLVWPSASYAVELLAWDLLLGIALLLAGAALSTDHSAHGLRIWLSLTGALCIAGLVGPAVGNMRLQLIGVFSYAVLLPFVAWKFSRWFRAMERRHLPSAALGSGCRRSS